jgi:hypothetical protein
MAMTSPAAALADEVEHAQAEVANAEAQWDLAQQEALALQHEGQQDAANARMIGLLRSEAMRQRQLDLARNAEAMEQVASDLAATIRHDGATLQAANEIGILRIKADRIRTHVADEVANAYAQGRESQIVNALAMQKFWDGVADFLTGTQAEQNVSNVEQIADEQADAVYAPSVDEAANAEAMGAEDLFAGDLALQAGAVDAASALVDVQADQAALLDHAQSSLNSARVHLEEVLDGD